MNDAQRLAQAERDADDLHRALAEALRRIHLANVSLDVYRQPPIVFRDLLEVLERISKTDADGHYIDEDEGTFGRTDDAGLFSYGPPPA